MEVKFSFLQFELFRSGMQGPVRPSTVPVMQQPKLPQSLNPSVRQNIN